jgi:hypothetical protein
MHRHAVLDVTISRKRQLCFTLRRHGLHSFFLAKMPLGMFIPHLYSNYKISFPATALTVEEKVCYDPIDRKRVYLDGQLRSAA